MNLSFILAKGTIDEIFILRRIQKEYIAKEKNLYKCFVDLEKEFDGVPWKVMEWAMKKKAIPKAMIRAVMGLYKVARAKVIGVTYLSEEFEVNIVLHILFTVYIKPLSAIIDSHSIIHHSFADELQLQISAPPDKISELLHSMQSCIFDVKTWATVNMLRHNGNKTELMLVTSKSTKHLYNLLTSISIGNTQIPFKQSVKNFGITLDCHLTMNAHISNIAQICYFELRCLTSIR